MLKRMEQSLASVSSTHKKNVGYFCANIKRLRSGLKMALILIFHLFSNFFLLVP